MTGPLEHDTPISPRLCPACGYMMNMATALRGSEGPEPGDLAICLSCGAYLCFNEDLSYREIDEERAFRGATAKQRFETTLMVAAIKNRGRIVKKEGKA